MPIAGVALRRLGLGLGPGCRQLSARPTTWLRLTSTRPTAKRTFTTTHSAHQVTCSDGNKQLENLESQDYLKAKQWGIRLPGDKCQTLEVPDAADASLKLGEIPAPEPWDGVVTAAPGHEVLASWTLVTAAGGYEIKTPASLPLWNPPSTQLQTPFDTEAAFTHAMKSPSPQLQLPFEPEAAFTHAMPGIEATVIETLFTAVRALNPDFRFDGVDVIAHASQLGLLLSSFIERNKSHRRRGAFYLSMVNNTLVFWHPRGILGSGPSKLLGAEGHLHPWLMRACTGSAPVEYGGDMHLQTMSYKLGPLTCATIARVDAMSAPDHDFAPGHATLQELGKGTTLLNLQRNVPGSDPRARNKRVRFARLTRNRDNRNWFARPDVLYRATVTEADRAVCTAMDRYDGTAWIAEWERKEENQLALRRLATVLSVLHRIVKEKAPDGQTCVAFVHANPDKPFMSVFPAVREDIIATDAMKQMWSTEVAST